MANNNSAGSGKLSVLPSAKGFFRQCIRDLLLLIPGMTCTLGPELLQPSTVYVFGVCYVSPIRPCLFFHPRVRFQGVRVVMETNIIVVEIGRGSKVKYELYKINGLIQSQRSIVRDPNKAESRPTNLAEKMRVQPT